MCNISGFEFIRIENLGDYFVRHCLKVPPTNGPARDVIFLVNRARDYVSKEAPQELFRNLLHSMNPKQAVETKRIFGLFLCERLNVVNEQAPGFAAARAPGGLVNPLLPLLSAAGLTRTTRKNARRSLHSKLPRRSFN